MKKILLLLAALSIGGHLMAQTGTSINDDGSSPDPSSVLQVQSNSKGLLIPRMTKAQRNAIPNPADGLMIYQTDGLRGMYYYDNFNNGGGPDWIRVVSKWSNFNDSLGAIYFNPPNVSFPKVGIGMASPRTYLDVAGSIRVGANGFSPSSNNPPINGMLVGGPVGINTDVADQNLLTIGGINVAAIGTGLGGYFQAKNAGTGQYETYFVPRGNPSNSMQMYYGSGGMNIMNGNSVSTLYISPAGNVGINMPALPSTPPKFSVQGNGFYTGNLSVGTSNGNTNAGNKLSITGKSDFTDNVSIGAQSSNNNNRLTVTGGNSDFIGNVSIGQQATNASNKFSVTGGNADFTGNVGIGFQTTNNGNKLSVNGTSDITGNLGVGIANPAYKLHVVGAAKLTGDMIFDSNVSTGGNLSVGQLSTNNGHRLSVNGESNFTNKVSIGTVNANNMFTVSGKSDFSDNVAIGTTGTNFSNRLTVAGNSDFTGNVGIGVANPQSKVDINVGTSQMKISSSASGDDEGSYPILVTGSKQGIRIEVDAPGGPIGGPGNDNYFLSFHDASNNARAGYVCGENWQDRLTDPFWIVEQINWAIETATTYADAIADAVGLDDFDKIPLDIVKATAKLAITVGKYSYEQANHTPSGVTFASGHADYAEWLERKDINEKIYAGEIVGVSGGRITKNTDNASNFMVISAAPMVLGNMPDLDKQKNFEKVAFVGQVPVKVFGMVKVGDYILPSGKHDGAGYAVSPDKMQIDDYSKIVGIAWESNLTNGAALINTLVSVSTKDISSKIAEQQKQIDDLNKQLTEVNQFLKSKFPDYNTYSGDDLALSIDEDDFKPGKNHVTPPTSLDKMDYGYMIKVMESEPKKLESILKLASRLCKDNGIDVDNNPKAKEMLTSEHYLNLLKTMKNRQE